MKPKPPPQKMKNVSKRILDMKPGDVILFKGGSASSVRTTLTRIREREKGRQFTSKKVSTGVHVWRIA